MSPSSSTASSNGDRRASDMSTVSESGSARGEMRLDRLMTNNREWSKQRIEEDPDYFNRLCDLQTPEYLWIGCADSRVPANVLAGLAPGEVFTQRNVGNQAMHTDLNCQTCIEYSVSVLKVKTIIVCGHYNCGAVAAALKMPSKSPGLVNCWISDIRECRNQHWDQLKNLSETEQIRRLCEFNVLRQTFHVCTSPAVQAAWDRGQELSVVGVVYDLKNGLLKKLVGPLAHDTDLTARDPNMFMVEVMEQLLKSAHLERMDSGKMPTMEKERIVAVSNTVSLMNLVARHTSWAAEPKEAASRSPSRTSP